MLSPLVPYSMLGLLIAFAGNKHWNELDFAALSQRTSLFQGLPPVCASKWYPKLLFSNLSIIFSPMSRYGSLGLEALL